MAQSLIIESTSTTGKKIRKAITDVNPNVSNANLKTFGQMANALTTNTYGSSVKVGKDEVQPVSALKTYSKAEYGIHNAATSSTVNAQKVITTTLNSLFGSADPAMDVLFIFGAMAFVPIGENTKLIKKDKYKIEVVSTPPNSVAFASCCASRNNWFINFGIPNDDADSLGEFKFRIPEHDGYAPYEFSVVVNANS